MTNLLSYCGLVDAKIRPSDIDLPVKSLSNLFVNLLESLRYQKDTLKLTDLVCIYQYSFPSDIIKADSFNLVFSLLGQGLLYLDGRNSQKYLHQEQADF